MNLTENSHPIKTSVKEKNNTKSRIHVQKHLNFFHRSRLAIVCNHLLNVYCSLIFALLKVIYGIFHDIVNGQIVDASQNASFTSKLSSLKFRSASNLISTTSFLCFMFKGSTTPLKNLGDILNDTELLPYSIAPSHNAKKSMNNINKQSTNSRHYHIILSVANYSRLYCIIEYETMQY